MGWCEVRVTDCHLDVLMTSEHLYCPQIDAGHDETRDVSMAEDMPSYIVKQRISFTASCITNSNEARGEAIGSP